VKIRVFSLGLLLLCPVAFAAENVVTNGGFESGMNGWRVWARAPNAISAALDTEAPHEGKTALRLEHSGKEDWSVEPSVRMDVKVGDLVGLECWVKVQGSGVVTLCASTWDSQGKVGSWSYGERSAYEGPAWQRLTTRLVVPANVTQIQPRLIGYGPATVRVDDYAVVRQGNVAAMRPSDLPATLTLRNDAIEATFRIADATLSVWNPKGGRRWTQKPFSSDCVVKNARLEGGRLRCELFHGGTGLDLSATLQLDNVRPELVVQLSAQGEMPAQIRFPHPFAGESGDYLVVPMNEGISYPVDDPTISPIHLIAYGGHGICMAFYGVTDGEKGQMTILETPDDASIRVERLDGRLLIVPEWESQRGQFGYSRKARFVFFERGGHVAMAKRYRAYAKQIGLFKTLDEKRKANPNVDLLIGAVNVWCWDRNAVPLVRDMRASGIEHILWSNQQRPEDIKAMNELGVLTSRYDIYQDVMAPTNFSRLQWIHPDWTSNAWPKDIILNRRGDWIKGWGVESKDGSMIPCGVICDKRAPDYARERVPADMATHPYRCRFIDTTTAAPWNECYNADHPMTRTDSRTWKMELLRYVSEDSKLVTGCETGHDASVPFLHYFEGMMSLGPYRVPDAGRRMSEIWTNVPTVVAKFQLGHDYRLPLWELVYHDCVVSQWYWGDYNNKLPVLWDKRDLFNVLYGVPPMFMFNKSLWEQNKARFVRSYQNTCPHVRKVGYQEMTDHRFLTKDRTVQQTVFANGVTITVNFGVTPYSLPDGVTVEPMGYRVKE